LILATIPHLYSQWALLSRFLLDFGDNPSVCVLWLKFEPNRTKIDEDTAI
jgi:hypothetical protein